MTAKPFTPDVERDARLVAVCAKHGPEALRSQAMMLGEEFAGGPDRLQEHAEWLRSDKAYLDRVTARVLELLKDD